VATLQRGRKAIASPIEITNLRELTRGDLAVLAQPRPPNSLKELRDNHHRIARAIASGMSNIDVALACGVTPNRVSAFRSDPSMVELIAHYRSLKTADWLKEYDPVIDFLRSNALKAAAMTSDILDAKAEAGEVLPVRELLGIQEIGFDRTGYGKVNKNVNVNVDFAANLEAMRKRSSRAREPRQIEASAPRPQSPQGEVSSPPGRPVAPSFRRL
jgi:hypothetical protein